MLSVSIRCRTNENKHPYAKMGLTHGHDEMHLARDKHTHAFRVLEHIPCTTCQVISSTIPRRNPINLHREQQQN